MIIDIVVGIFQLRQVHLIVVLIACLDLLHEIQPRASIRIDIFENQLKDFGIDQLIGSVLDGQMLELVLRDPFAKIRAAHG